MSENPYLIERIVKEIKSYNPNYGDEKLCKCGHTYGRHFDPYEDMDPVGCKYCGCEEFEPNDGKLEQVENETLAELNSISPNWTTVRYSKQLRFFNANDSIVIDYFEPDMMNGSSDIFRATLFDSNGILKQTVESEWKPSGIEAYDDLKRACNDVVSNLTRLLDNI